DDGFGSVLPRLQLRLVRDKETVALTEIPASSDGGTIDFGRLTVADTAVLQVGSTGYFAMPGAAALPVKPPITTTILPPGATTPPVISPLISKIAVGDVVSSAGVQLTRAQTALKSGDSQFRLGNVSMQLKMVPADD